MDELCNTPWNDPHGGLGCNAGGKGDVCRFCGFAHFPACPNEVAAVVMAAVISGTVESFDDAARENYKLGLRNLFEVGKRPSEIILNVSAASLLVEAVLIFDSMTAATSASAELAVVSPDDLSMALGVTVEEIAEVNPPEVYDVEIVESSDYSALITGEGGAAGPSLLMGMLGGLLLLATAILYRRRRRQSKAFSKELPAEWDPREERKPAGESSNSSREPSTTSSEDGERGSFDRDRALKAALRRSSVTGAFGVEPTSAKPASVPVVKGLVVPPLLMALDRPTVVDELGAARLTQPAASARTSERERAMRAALRRSSIAQAVSSARRQSQRQGILDTALSRGTVAEALERPPQRIQQPNALDAALGRSTVAEALEQGTPTSLQMALSRPSIVEALEDVRPVQRTPELKAAAAMKAIGAAKRLQARARANNAPPSRLSQTPFIAPRPLPAPGPSLHEPLRVPEVVEYTMRANTVLHALEPAKKPPIPQDPSLRDVLSDIRKADREKTLQRGTGRGTGLRKQLKACTNAQEPAAAPAVAPASSVPSRAAMSASCATSSVSIGPSNMAPKAQQLLGGSVRTGPAVGQRANGGAVLAEASEKPVRPRKANRRSWTKSHGTIGNAMIFDGSVNLGGELSANRPQRIRI